MTEWLILRLPRTPDAPAHWLIADAHGRPLSNVESGTLTLAAAGAGGRRLCALVHSGDVLGAQVEVPARSGARLQQIVPYALEEQLAADVETLHFAIGPHAGASTRVSVAVVARSLMTEWLESLAAHGLAPEVLCPESALLPINPGHSVMLVEGDTLYLRRSDGSVPVALPADSLEESLKVALVDTDALAAEHLIAYLTPLDWQRRSAEMEALRSRVASLKVQLLNSGVLPLLAPQLASSAYINLLQGTYAPKNAFTDRLRRWRLAATLAAALLVLHVGGQSLNLLQLKRTERGLDESTRALVAAALPGDTGTGAVRQRVQQRLAAAQAQSGGGGFIGALAALARALANVGGATMEGMSFREGVVDLKVRAADAASLERINQALRSDGWQAELTSGNAVPNGYEGRIQMRGAGAR
ncbi:MAG: type II secretion system protein GspL [Steroidobacterales bacterium]